MRRSDKECTEKLLRTHFLRDAQILHLALSVPDGVPYIVPLNYVYDEAIYFHSAAEGRKVTLLRQNPFAGFAVSEQVRIRVSHDNPCATGTNYRSVAGKGKVSFIESTEGKSQILNKLMAKYAQSQPFEYKDKMLNKVLVIKLEILEMTFKVDLR